MKGKRILAFLFSERREKRAVRALFYVQGTERS